MQAASRTSWALGSNVSMTAMHSRRDVAETALGAAFDALEQVEALMSIYRPQSQLCRLNRGGVIDDPHPWLVDVLRRAGAMSRRSGGAFDCTVQPLWEVCAQARRDGRRPDQSEIDAAREKIDWRRVEISPRRIQLRGAGTQVTLNGIAQGYATDRAMAALRTHGVSHALVDAGEIGTLGERSPRRPWTVGIQHPRRPEAYVSLAKLAGRCLATSGDYATSFSDDRSPCQPAFRKRV